jgi:hypothetical protein
MPEIDPERTRKLILEVSSKSSGVFLWVRLVVQILLESMDAGDGIDELERQIEIIPPELRGLMASTPKCWQMCYQNIRKKALHSFFE